MSSSPELKQELGLLAAVSVVINRIIGSGIFRTPAPIMLLVGSSIPFYSVWIIGGIITILSALCYAELVAMIPRSGGPYVFLKEAYPPFVTFLRGWAMFFVSETGAIVAVSIFFSENFIRAFGFEEYCSPLIFSLGVVWSLTLLNCIGVKISGYLQIVFSFAKIGILAFIALVGLFHMKDVSLLTSTVDANWSFSLATIVAMGEALRYGFFAYSGWEGTTYVAEEVKNPRRNLPLSLIVGILGVMAIYILVSTAYVATLGANAVATSKAVAVDAMSSIFGNWGAVFVGVAIMISTFGNVNTQIFCKSRTWFAMGRDGLFFRFFKYVSPRFHTPNGALLGQAVWATVMIAVVSMAENAYEAVIDYFTFTSSIFNILTMSTVWILRKKLKDMPRPYKAWGYPYTLIFLLVFYGIFAVHTLITAFIPSLLGLLLTLTGFIYYRFLICQRRH